MKIEIFCTLIKVEIVEIGLDPDTLEKIQKYSLQMYMESSNILRSIIWLLFGILDLLSVVRFGKRFNSLNEKHQTLIWNTIKGYIGYSQIRIFLRTTSLLRLVEVDSR